MSDEMIEKAQKYLTFVYVTLKIGVRDLYVLPIGHINSLLKTAGILMIITGICETFDLLSKLYFALWEDCPKRCVRYAFIRSSL